MEKHLKERLPAIAAGFAAGALAAMLLALERGEDEVMGQEAHAAGPEQGAEYSRGPHRKIIGEIQNFAALCRAVLMHSELVYGSEGKEFNGETAYARCSGGFVNGVDADTGTALIEPKAPLRKNDFRERSPGEARLIDPYQYRQIAFSFISPHARASSDGARVELYIKECKGLFAPASDCVTTDAFRAEIAEDGLTCKVNGLPEPYIEVCRETIRKGVIEAKQLMDTADDIR